MTFTAIALLLGLLAGSLYAIWKAHEERKAEQRTFQKIAQANTESRERIGPRPVGVHSAPWRDRRRA